MPKFLAESRRYRGSAMSVLIGATAVAVLLVYAIVEQENRYPTLSFLAIGLGLTWREYVIFRRRRRQRGIELIGTQRVDGER